MNKYLLAIVSTLLTVVNGYSVDKQYFTGGFQFESSTKNTSADECPLSLYKKGSFVFFRNDSALMFNSQSDLDMGKAKVCKELMELGITGTFAYDQRHGKIYFTKKSEGENSLIYEATENQGKWTNIHPVEMVGTKLAEDKVVGSSLKHGRYVFFHDGEKGMHNPTLANGGKRLYFSASFKSGLGARDIWYSDLDEKTSVWSRPALVNDSLNIVNTQYNEDYPFVVGDSLLYFSSERPEGEGGYDLFVSRYDKKKKLWGAAENLGDVFNTNANEYNIVSKAEAVYFLSDREEGKGGTDVYFPVARKFQPGEELLADFKIEEPLDFNWVLFFFDINKSSMEPEYESQLDELASAMLEFPDAKFVIRGYTDNRGTVELNKKLSLQRAVYIRQMLIYRGLNGKKIVVVGKGMDDPVIPNAQTEFEHEQNRRVEVQLMSN